MEAEKPPRKVPLDKQVDRAYPHQVAITADKCAGRNYDKPFVFCRGLSIYPINQRVSDGTNPYEVFRFRDAKDAEAFLKAFDGIPFFPEDRAGKKWRRPLGDVRRQ